MNNRNKKQRLLILLSAFLFFSCTSDNEVDKYEGGGSDLPAGEIAHFPLNGDLSNGIEESNIQLFYKGKGNPEFVSGAGIEGTQALKLDGENNYLMIPTGVYDTLSVVFWVKMDNEYFRSKNLNPVWIDYGLGAIKVSVDCITGSTKLRITEGAFDPDPSSQLLPAGQWDNICTWDNKAFFYTEIIKDKVTCRVKTKYADFEEKNYNLSVDKSESPVDIKSEVFYIGRSSGIGPYSGEYLQGIVDDIHIYNRGLTEAEVNAFAQIPLD